MERDESRASGFGPDSGRRRAGKPRGLGSRLGGLDSRGLGSGPGELDLAGGREGSPSSQGPPRPKSTGFHSPPTAQEAAGEGGSRGAAGWLPPGGGGRSGSPRGGGGGGWTPQPREAHRSGQPLPPFPASTEQDGGRLAAPELWPASSCPSDVPAPRPSPLQASPADLLRDESLLEEGEDAAASVGTGETLSQQEREELRKELAKVEEEIQTLSQVLAAKEKRLADIKRQLGVSSLQELRQNLSEAWQDVTATTAYKRTSETLSQAGQKASAAFSSVGSVITKKLEDVSIRSIQHSISMPAMRNSPTFKSFEEKVETLKSKVGGPKPGGGDFGEVLNSTANASAPPPEPVPEQPREGQ
uniref:Tumor protein D52 n=1 Tax=Ornithorhynchus anatinus TaxID=9258 RepID=A0A6I8PPN5_ORNAN